MCYNVFLHSELPAKRANQRTQHCTAYDTTGYTCCHRTADMVTEVTYGMSKVVVGSIVAIVPQPAAGAIVTPTATVVADTSFPSGDVATIGDVIVVVEVCQRATEVVHRIEVTVVPEPAVIAEVAPATIVVAHPAFPAGNKTSVINSRSSAVMTSHLVTAKTIYPMTARTVHFVTTAKMTIHLMTARTIHLMTATRMTIHLVTAARMTIHLMTATGTIHFVTATRMTVHLVTATGTVHLVTAGTSHTETAVAVHNYFSMCSPAGSRASAATLSKAVVYHGHHDDHHQHLE